MLGVRPSFPRARRKIPTSSNGRWTPPVTNRIHVYVGEDRKILTGRDAEALLREHSDSNYVDEVSGIVCVPNERWAMAQRYERGTWMEDGVHAFDDRNVAHATNFDGYAFLHGRSFARAIELGCGPFTNLRLIAGECKIDRCTLLDPLIYDYLRHRNCNYRHGILKIGATTLDFRLSRNRFARAIRRLIRAVRPTLLISGVPLEKALATPIEEMPECGKFDLVVMINVLEHCFNAHEIFRRVRKLCHPGTLFVFHDRLYRAAEVKREVMARFDAGHPLRVDESVILRFLHNSFRALIDRRVNVEDEVAGITLTEPGIYFVGEFK